MVRYFVPRAAMVPRVPGDLRCNARIKISAMTVAWN